MRATTLLLAQHRRILTLVTAAAVSAAARDELMEAVATHIATAEGVIYPVVERDLALDVSPQRDGHVRARLALFRLATTSEEAFPRHLAWLDRVLREHALAESAIVRAMEESLSPAALIRLGERMTEFQMRLGRAPQAQEQRALAS